MFTDYKHPVFSGEKHTDANPTQTTTTVYSRERNQTVTLEVISLGFDSEKEQ